MGVVVPRANCPINEGSCPQGELSLGVDVLRGQLSLGVVVLGVVVLGG